MVTVIKYVVILFTGAVGSRQQKLRGVTSHPFPYPPCGGRVRLQMLLLARDWVGGDHIPRNHTSRTPNSSITSHRSPKELGLSNYNDLDFSSHAVCSLQNDFRLARAIASRAC